MNIFLVYAHPEEKSFCAALKDQAVNLLERQGHNVVISDLYAMNFEPTLTKNDFLQRHNETFFKPQLEQVHASKTNSFSEEIKREQQKVANADVLLFYFPFWWFSFPAIMKGWIDKVFAMNVAYGGEKGLYENGPFRGKKSMLVLTTGGDKEAYTPDGRNDDIMKYLFAIHHGILSFTGMDIFEPFIVYSPARLSEEDRLNIIERHKQIILSLADRSLLNSYA